VPGPECLIRRKWLISEVLEGQVSFWGARAIVIKSVTGCKERRLFHSARCKKPKPTKPRLRANNISSSKFSKQAKEDLSNGQV
ncbi:hypothetical protein GOODEAATRI_029439, partial [Goodea atripinnis]